MSTPRYATGYGNRKTGPMLTITTERTTCPKTCPFYRKGCYAEYGPLRWQWDKVTSTGMSFSALLTTLKRHALRYPAALVRYAVAGDLPGTGAHIQWSLLAALCDALHHPTLRLFTFTHKPLTPRNKEYIREANTRGFTINISATGLTEADAYADLAIAPVVTVLPDTTAKYTPAGRKIVYCPAETTKHTSTPLTCADCKLCAIPTRKSIVAFTPHGTGKNHVKTALTQRP